MYDRTTIMNLIEDAERARPYCFCGAHMVARERDGALRLECAAPRKARRGLLARLATLEWLDSHESRLIIDGDELRAA
jgi:hypothetical protein